MKDLISVIIPVYNVEKYLDRCIKSVVNQTYRNLEILLIDDASTDQSGQKCDVWIKEDTRIKVIHKKNGGVSSARNLGIEMANGKYIIFIDSDDYVSNDYVQKLYEQIDNDTKIVRIVKGNNDKIQIYSEVFFKMFDDLGEFHSAWNQIVERQMLIDNHIRFNQKVGFGEDFLFSMQAMICAKVVKMIDFDGYKYCNNPTSVTRIINKSVMMKNIYELSIIYTEIYNRFNEDTNYFNTNNFFVETNRYILQMFDRCSVKYEEFRLLMNKIYKNLNEMIFEKFDKDKKYRVDNKIFIYCLLKKRIRLYYFFIEVRKKIKCKGK